MCWYFIKGFTYIFSQQLCEMGNICLLYMRKVSTVWFTSLRAPWSGEARHDPVLAQDSNIRRPWTHFLHEYTKSIPVFRAVPSGRTRDRLNSFSTTNNTKRDRDAVTWGTPHLAPLCGGTVLRHWEQICLPWGTEKEPWFSRATRI